jgi:hypothetical protein
MFTLLLSLLFYLTGWWPQQNVAADATRDSGNLIISTDVELVILDVSVKDRTEGMFRFDCRQFQVFEDESRAIKHFSTTIFRLPLV